MVRIIINCFNGEMHLIERFVKKLLYIFNFLNKEKTLFRLVM